MSAIPDGLRQPELVRYLLRANQLRQVKPAIAYWCEYYVLDQIISRQLHTADQDCLAWTTALMDRLEQTKTENADNDTITDDTAGQAYVEQFAQQAFERGERVLRANKVTKQTAETFDAAATFFSLAKVWGPIDEETKQKILFCKWNAARILKALRAGEDPNASNPVLDEHPPADTTTTDTDADLEAGLASAAAAAASTSASAPLPASVQDADDDGDIALPNAPPSPPAADFLPSVPPQAVAPRVLDAPAIDPPSPLSVTEDMPTWQAGVSAAVSPTVPTTPAVAAPVSPQMSPVRGGFSPAVAPVPVATPVPAATPIPVATPVPAWQPPTNHGFSADEVDAAKAQKHAKWAISALNFEDVPTAVKELRNALAALGAL